MSLSSGSWSLPCLSLRWVFWPRLQHVCVCVCMYVFECVYGGRLGGVEYLLALFALAVKSMWNSGQQCPSPVCQLSVLQWTCSEQHTECLRPCAFSSVENLGYPAFVNLCSLLIFPHTCMITSVHEALLWEWVQFRGCSPPCGASQRYLAVQGCTAQTLHTNTASQNTKIRVVLQTLVHQQIIRQERDINADV